MIVELIKLVAEGEELFAVNVEYASGFVGTIYLNNSLSAGYLS